MALGAHGIVLRKACAVERKEFAEKIPGSVPRAKQERKGLSERKAKTHSFSHGKWKNAYIWKVTILLDTPIFDFHDYGRKCS